MTFFGQSINRPRRLDTNNLLDKAYLVKESINDKKYFSIKTPHFYYRSKSEQFASYSSLFFKQEHIPIKTGATFMHDFTVYT